MKYYLIIFLAIIASAGLSSSCNHDRKIPSQKWYTETKTEILKESELQPDTTVTNVIDSVFTEKHLLNKSHEFKKLGYKKGKLGLEIYYSTNGDFKLVRELYNNETLFEGIAYKDQFYGLSTWKNVNGFLSEQGVRYKNNKIGIWKRYDENGVRKDDTDYKQQEFIDSMPLISNKS